MLTLKEPQNVVTRVCASCGLPVKLDFERYYWNVDIVTGVRIYYHDGHEPRPKKHELRLEYEISSNGELIRVPPE